MNQLASYTICARLDGPGYDIRIVGNNGIRQTMLGFTTHAEAAAWISGDIRLDTEWTSARWGLP
jgi:hypothetical protein